METNEEIMTGRTEFTRDEKQYSTLVKTLRPNLLIRVGDDVTLIVKKAHNGSAWKLVINCPREMRIDSN